VNLVVNFQLQLDAAGNVTTRDYADLMATAQAGGLKVEGLVHNFSGSSFDAGIATNVLSNPDVRAQAVANLLAVAKARSLSGINVDVENVPPGQRANYTAFIKELSTALKPAGLSLSVSIPAKTWDDTTSAWSGAFDYKSLGQYADKVIPMAYDEHLPGYYPGPVASVGWVEKVAAFAASQMPSDKVVLGIAAYGYDWKKGTTEGGGLSVPQAMNLAAKYGAEVKWDAVAQVPYFTYTADGVDRIVYYEDARALGPKLDLVTKYDLAGIAIWRLGLEDPAIWPVIEAKLR
jgi:spore germination protein YaaH